MQPEPSYTGRPRRRRKTHWSVSLMDWASRAVITVSGIGTIAAVSLVGVFLVWVAFPLFWPASFGAREEVSVPEVARPLCLRVDEEQRLAWTLSRDGGLTVFRLDSGETLEQRSLVEGKAPTSVSLPFERSRQEGRVKVRYTEVAFGFADGTVRTCRLRFRSAFPETDQLPEEVRRLPAGEAATVHDLTLDDEEVKGGVVVRTPQDQLRVEYVEPEVLDSARSASKSPVRLLAYTLRDTHPPEYYICRLGADGKLRFSSAQVQKNFLTLEETLRWKKDNELPYTPPPGRGPPAHMLLSGVGDQLFLVWEDGYCRRYNVRDPQKSSLAEEVDLTPDEGVRVTALEQAIGRATLLVGDSAGTVRAWFLAVDEETNRANFVNAHTFTGDGQAITAFAVSSRTRLAAAGNTAGRARMLYLTSHNVLGEVTADPGRPVAALAIAPRDNGLIALADGQAWRWAFDPGHPEATPGSLFTRVWYEGYTEPIHKWEATSGADAFEPKFGMVPLIFGTLKAAFYSLLFGVPLALLAAIYTSEFMNPTTRTVVKPTIEMMASLPSVVLGFLAGLVFAELVEPVVATVLACFLTVPFAFVLGARLVQFLPGWLAVLLTHYRLALFLLTLPVGLAASLVVAPAMEWVFFGGDLRAWLNDPSQSALGGWMFLFVPLGLLATSFFMVSWVNPWLRRITADWGRSRVALTDLIRFLVGCTVAFALALACSAVVTALGFDARNVYLGTYDRRNSLIVCFVMGFAIIPIIYTIAEDALSSVPEHLRSGSLATGATPWQTATRIVIPTAMSGLFSAVMVGMGRAIGETMIVVMATGNTAVLDGNIFNGFRALSANLAVELPEAVRGSTHYRTLFLGAVVLFGLTFVLNTVAEVIRLRFRRRAYQL